MVAAAERERYRSDLGMNWAVLPALIAIPLAAAAGLAWCLKLAFVHGWYLIFLLPIFGGILLGGVLHGIIGWTHCRNRWLAVTLGIVAGLVGYLGYYELCLMALLPPQARWRVDLLPRYIAFRMETDVSKEVGKPKEIDRAPKRPFVALNWLTFACELSIVVGAAGAVAWRRARRAYCPQLRQWMQQETALVPPTSVEALRDALDADTLAEFVANTPPVADAQQACRLIVEYATPTAGSPLEYPVYLSVEGVPATRPWHLTRNELWMIQLMVQFKDGPRELLLSADSTQWTPMTNARRRRAVEDWCRRINTLRA